MLKNKTKSTKLLLSICFDLLGFVSYLIPLFDVIWAPLSSYMMTQLYGGKKGLLAAVFVFIEEALPLSDVIPSFSIMWFYSYYLDKETSEKE
jgi:hypothetical protein